jgi:hypothetical protein
VAAYLNPGSKEAPALADVRVRQALGWGVDREELVKLATNGLTKPSPSWLASNPGYQEAASTGFTSFDGTKAANLLDEAGWKLVDGKREKDGRPFVLRLLTFGAEAATVTGQGVSVRRLRASPPALRIKGVRHAYSSKAPDVLRGLDLELATGESVGLLGRSGSGKSTLIKCLVGLEQPSTGLIKIAGLSTGDASWKSLRRHVQLVPQDPPRIPEPLALRGGPDQGPPGFPRHRKPNRAPTQGGRATGTGGPCRSHATPAKPTQHGTVPKGQHRQSNGDHTEVARGG